MNGSECEWRRLDCGGKKEGVKICIYLRTQRRDVMRFWANSLQCDFHKVCNRRLKKYSASADEVFQENSRQYLSDADESRPNINFRSRYAIWYDTGDSKDDMGSDDLDPGRTMCLFPSNLSHSFRVSLTNKAKKKKGNTL